MSITKICVQKFLPHHQAIADKINQSSGEEHSKLSAAFYTKKLWPANTEIFITFMNDDPQIIRTPLPRDGKKIDPLQQYFSDNPQIKITDAIKKIVQERIQPLTNLKLTFADKSAVTSKNLVKIDFDPDMAWSLVGTDCIGHEGATMNLGWFDVSTVMHEFGHVLGMVHEHQNPKGQSIQWNPEAVYSWSKLTQGWDKATTDTNILNKYANDQINGSKFDPMSIMLYFFPASLTLNNKGTEQNLRISGEDALWISKTYPNGPENPEQYYQQVYGMSLQKALNASKSSNYKNKFILLFIVLFVLLMCVLLYMKYHR